MPMTTYILLYLNWYYFSIFSLLSYELRGATEQMFEPPNAPSNVPITLHKYSVWFLAPAGTSTSIIQGTRVLWEERSLQERLNNVLRQLGRGILITLYPVICHPARVTADWLSALSSFLFLPCRLLHGSFEWLEDRRINRMFLSVSWPI